ncbi:TetR/AcrR family transcriptional regulator [Cellulomonas sp. P22]|uniref:TetR/AcrR family transcriptional regulator n=1 Tax=Cellulomonas sp. P22 TaxID=3373189 RepID=UPI0037A62721
MNQRLDAQRNRAKLVAAAAEVFREDGAAAPLDLVARRAAVGRGTLYRHFPDRGSLVAAVLDLRMAALERYAATYPGDDLLEHLLVEICALQLDTPGLMTVVRSSPDPRLHLDELTRRTSSLLSAAVHVAHRAGTVRPDVTLTDVHLAVAMVDGVISMLPRTPGADPVARALELVLRALRSPDRAAEPVPAPELRLATPQDVDAAD